MNLQDYYMTAELYEPPFFENREFGIIKKSLISPTNPHGWKRHMGFKNVEKLRAFLIGIQPDHVFFSSAKYENPATYPMEEKHKGWLGSDLIFDIDDDDLPEGTSYEAALHIVVLRDKLRKDFGLEVDIITFSGSRGYHAHVQDERIQMLNKYERGEITDYFAMYLDDEKVFPNPNYCGIDPIVTPDVSRLIRLPGSIHGKTGKQCRIIRPI